MSEPRQDSNEGLMEGVVVKIGSAYGFIEVEGAEENYYFKNSWFQGHPPLKRGEAVTFKSKIYNGNLQAHFLRRADEGAEAPSDQALLPKDEHAFNWAYFGYMPNVLQELAGLALDEQWEFREGFRDPERPLPILHSYLRHTFGRLVLEKKILVDRDGAFAAFNTGLVDSRYENIYALFRRNDRDSHPWRLANFCIAGEDTAGQNLVRHFNPLPRPAHYFEKPADLYYDTRAGKPELSWRHCVIDRLDRYPREFLEDHWPPSFPKEDVVGMMTWEERKEYYREFGEAVERDQRVYRMIMNRVKDAVDLSIKRAAWNFKTAVPQYYPKVRRLQLLLPICLVSDERPDMALAVEKTEVGSYLGHTVLPLDWAYRNARLICRPDSDWLEPTRIAGIENDEDEA